MNGNQSDGGRQGTGAPNRGEGAGRFHITSYRLLDISLFDKHTKHSSISTRRSQTVCPIHPICFYFHKENSSLFLLQGQKEENNQRILSNVESNICNNMKYDFFFFFFFVCLFVLLLLFLKIKNGLERLFCLLLFDFFCLIEVAASAQVIK